MRVKCCTLSSSQTSRLPSNKFKCIQDILLLCLSHFGRITSIEKNIFSDPAAKVHQLLNRPGYGSLDNRTRRSKSPTNTPKPVLKPHPMPAKQEPPRVSPTPARPDLDARFKKNERVVCLNDNFNEPAFGVVRIVKKFTKTGNKWMAGIELVSLNSMPYKNWYQLSFYFQTKYCRNLQQLQVYQGFQPSKLVQLCYTFCCKITRRC